MRNITFDQEKLSAIIVAYKKYFPSHWKDEMYKWEAVQHFQKYWDVNAQNFLDMFMEATDKTYNLLANMNNYPRGMIKSFSTVDPEAVRSMFIQLFDESKELSERIDHFMSSAEELRVKYDDGTWKQHYQTANAISTYLWLKYPDKYYIYKYSEVRAVARKIDSDFVPKKGSSAANIENSFKLYNEIREILADDRELDKMFKSVLNESCYPDPRKISLMYQRNNKNYEMLINICYFVLDGMLQTTDKGNYKMMTFSDEHMHRLYEKFVLEYFKRHHSYLSEVRAAQVKWNLATDTEESMIRFLPAMQTDIFLRYKEKVLIIDTKYYGNSMQKQYDKVTIHSGNMYQIFTYVKNQDVENNGRVSGMLLYAKTEEAITPDCSFVIGGNKISVKTVDLNKEFKLIAAQLDKIAEDYFGKKRIEDSII